MLLRPRWTVNYFVIELNDEEYLLCNDIITMLKEHNIHQLYQTKYSSQDPQVTGKQWLEK